MMDISNKLGFCASYNKKQLYESSAMYKHNFEVSLGTFGQFAGDNADWYICTRDGKNIFLSNTGGQFKIAWTNCATEKNSMRERN